MSHYEHPPLQYLAAFVRKTQTLSLKYLETALENGLPVADVENFGTARMLNDERVLELIERYKNE